MIKITQKILQTLKLSIILFVILTNTMFAQNNKQQISITTMEFSNFRRFKITIPNNRNSEGNMIPSPKINKIPAKGKFEILIAPVNSDLYIDDIIKKDEGKKYPIRYFLDFPNSKSILIKGDTSPYKKIVAYNLIDTGEYLFDIYYVSLGESTLLEKSIAPVEISRSEKAKPKTLVVTSEKKVSSAVIEEQIDPREKKLITAIKTALIVVIGATVVLLATLLILKIFNARTDKLKNDLLKINVNSNNRDAKPDFHQVQSKAIKKTQEQNRKSGLTTKKMNNTNIVQEIQSPGSYEEKIKFLMKKNNISYDEAVILNNISGK